MNAEYMDFPFEIKSEEINENGSFTGYASVFDKKDDSRRWIDGIITEGDVVRYGAFTESISKGGRNGNGIVMLWQHMSDQVPGIWTSFEENKTGLKVKGDLLLDTQLGKESYVRAKNGAIKGLSIGFDTIEWSLDEKKKIREIKKAELWEISLVTFPAQKKANIIDVKSLEHNFKTMNERDFENYLREAGNLSREAAKYIVKLCKSNLREAEEKSTKLSTLKLIEKAMPTLYIRS